MLELSSLVSPANSGRSLWFLFVSLEGQAYHLHPLLTLMTNVAQPGVSDYCPRMRAVGICLRFCATRESSWLLATSGDQIQTT